MKEKIRKYFEDNRDIIVSELSELIKKNPELSKRNYYFAILTPHIAEYYYKTKTHFHTLESFERSLTL